MDDEVLQLLGGLDEWRVEMVGGGETRVRALSYSVEGGYYVFSAVEPGTPRKNIDLCWIPEALVVDVRGAFVSDTTRGP